MTTLTFADLKPETVAYLKGSGRASIWGQRTAIRGSRRRMPFMGRARLYANATHGGFIKAKAQASARDQIKRMMEGYHGHVNQARQKMDLIDRIQSGAPELMPHVAAIHQAIQGHLRSAKTYHRLTMMTHNSAVRKEEPRDRKGKWTIEQAAAVHQRVVDHLRGRDKQLAHLQQDNANDDRGSGHFFQRIAEGVKKDFDAGDVHLSTAIGNEHPRRRPKKYPPLSFARGV